MARVEGICGSSANNYVIFYHKNSFARPVTFQWKTSAAPQWPNHIAPKELTAWRT